MSLIKEAGENGLPVKKACKVIGISDFRYYSWLRDPDGVDMRTSPDRKMPDNPVTNPQLQMALSEEDVEEIKQELLKPDNSQKSGNQVYYTMVDNERVVCSLSTFHRYAKKLKLSATNRREKSKAKSRVEVQSGDRRKPLEATAPNMVWVWDISTFKMNQGNEDVYLFAVMDLYSRKLVKSQFYSGVSAKYAVEFFQEAFDSAQITKKTGLIIHSDNGGAMRAFETIGLFESYGVKYTYSRPHHSNDNPHIESLFDSLKNFYGLKLASVYTIDDANALLDNVNYRYNYEYYHSGINYSLPGVRYDSPQQEKVLMNKRNSNYQKYREDHPERFRLTRGKKVFEVAGTQYLNPSAEMISSAMQLPSGSIGRNVSNMANKMVKARMLTKDNKVPEDERAAKEGAN